MANLPGIGGSSKSQFYLEIARGKIAGHSTASILSFNPDIDAAAEETIWEQGGIYTYLTSDTELFISSTNQNDNNIIISIEGLTDDFKVKKTISTFIGGQSQQSIGIFFRIFKITVIGGEVPVGDLYAAETDTLNSGIPSTTSKIKAKMLQGFNVTKLGLFTVPIDHTMYITRLTTHTRKNKDAVISAVIRPFGFPGFLNVTQSPSFQNSFQLILEPSFVIKEKTDLELRVMTSTNQTEVVANIGYILIDNNKD